MSLSFGIAPLDEVPGSVRCIERLRAESTMRQGALALAQAHLPASFGVEQAQLPLPSRSIERGWKPLKRSRAVAAASKRPRSPSDVAHRQAAADPSVYAAKRDTWPSSPPRQSEEAKHYAALLAAMPPIVRTGSAMLGFDPHMPRTIKPPTEGTAYFSKRKAAAQEQRRRQDVGWDLLRHLEHVECTLPLESTQFGRLTEPTEPIVRRAPGLPLAISKRPNGLRGTHPSETSRQPPPEVKYRPGSSEAALSAATAAVAGFTPSGRPRSRQQPAVATPLYQSAMSAILPGGPDRPRTPGAGLPRRQDLGQEQVGDGVTAAASVVARPQSRGHSRSGICSGMGPSDIASRPLTPGSAALPHLLGHRAHFGPYI